MSKIKFMKDEDEIESTIEETTAMQNAEVKVDKLVAERKRILAYEICKKSKELNKLISQWTILFPDEIMPTEYYKKAIGQYDILNEMEV